MYSHVTLGCSDIARAAEFYDAVLAPLGHRRVHDYKHYVGWGEEGPGGLVFWICHPHDRQPCTAGNGTHIAFLAPSRQAVDAFHAAALAAGGSDEGAPGLRPHYHEHYYGAYVRDPDGNKIQAVCHEPA